MLLSKYSVLLFLAAASYLYATGKKRDAARWAARAAECARVALGDDSLEFEQYSLAACAGAAEPVSHTTDSKKLANNIHSGVSHSKEKKKTVRNTKGAGPTRS